MSVYVLTGTNGFIGANVLESLLKKEEEVAPAKRKSKFISKEEWNRNIHHSDIYLCCLTADLPESTIRHLHNRFLGSARVRFVFHTDLKKAIESLPASPKAIIHNGACSSTEETNPDIFKELNLEYSKMLWRIAAELDIPFLYASSASVYGDGSEGFSASKDKMKDYKPMNLYAQSKYDFDCWALEQDKKPSTWFGMRYFNVFGPHESHKARQASMVYHSYNQVLKTGKVRLYKSNFPEYSDGGQLRDFIYVKDIVAITWELLDIAMKRKAGQEIPISDEGCFVNLGTGNARSWNDLAIAVFDALGIRPNIEYIDMPEKLSKQYQNYTQADLQEWGQLSIKHSTTSLEEGVREYVQKYLARGL